jgi:hypothetical protein
VTLTLGFSQTPPATPWGINFGGGLNSTAVIIECRVRGFRPDWILFADTGSELPGTLEHVERMRKWCEGWQDVTTVRWIRQDGTFEALHDNCLRTHRFPSKAYGHAGCTDKWKVQPMERWRKAHGFDHGAFAVGYDTGESGRIKRACQRGDDPNMTAWYPLVAWNIDRLQCERICAAQGIAATKSSCFMCPNMREHEWAELKTSHPEFFAKALEIERQARMNGESPQAGLDRATAGFFFDPEIRKMILAKSEIPGQESLFTDDRCHHGGCFT